MVDAITGTRLWYAGNTSAADLNLSRMDHSIPSNVTVMDFDTDGYADRMYVGDMAGQLWKFDIYKNVTVSNLVTGGVIASLGNHDEAVASRTAAKNRRFYNAPDVAGVRVPGVAPFLNIAIGSGYRGHPLETGNQDRFYAIRDYSGFGKLTQAQYNSLTVITDSVLTNVTDLSTRPSATAKGWKLDLNYPSSTWQGEKVLVPSTTFQNQILFTSYSPTSSASNGAGTCSETVGSNRAYALNVVDGFPLPKYDTVVNRDGTTSTTVRTPAQGDRFVEMKQGGIAPELAFLFPGGNQVVCLSGAEVLGVCKTFDSRMKTYWRESGAE
jgi:type IV pilus assembly protein PilY1